MNYLLIGKPNVGKSSIFNIITGSYYNIVHPESGTTRDWHKKLIKDTSSYIYDTPGILINDKNKKNVINFAFNQILERKINYFLYVLDYNHGFNEVDHFAITNLRKHNKKIFLLVNKFDNFHKTPNEEFLKYGIDNIIFISCAHLYGIDNLKSLICKYALYNKKIIDHNFTIAIYGKPNVGKSTFLNTILGYERALTSPIAGTTSDLVVDSFNYKKKYFKIVDTAGIVKKANVKNKSIIFYSIKKSLENITKVDTGIVIIDSKDGLTRQDKRIINLISNKAKSIIIIFNKIDLIEKKIKFKSEIIEETQHSFHEIKNIKIFFITAFRKNNITKILDYLYESIFDIDYNISTSKLNNWLKIVTKNKQHPIIENKHINFKYVVQIKNKPITIKIFCSYSNKIKNNYKRYLINNFNYNFKILNQKTKIIFSSSKNPYL